MFYTLRAAQKPDNTYSRTGGGREGGGGGQKTYCWDGKWAEGPRGGEEVAAGGKTGLETHWIKGAGSSSSSVLQEGMLREGKNFSGIGNI